MPQVKISDQTQNPEIAVIESFEQINETRIIDNAIAEAEAEYNRTGVLLDVDKVLEELRRKYFE